MDDHLLFELYKLWKRLDKKTKEDFTRGINIPEYITEKLYCIINNYKHKTKKDDSTDAVDKNGKRVQIKATNNFHNDLTSFGPQSQFEILEFVRLDYENDIFYFYRIDISILEHIKVNKFETFNNQRSQKRRPRFSIINKILIPYKIQHYANVNMRTR
ncbi:MULTISPECIES: Bsp6I family type II restriction endonuclease [unclassified Mycoplasma]|uniref:Bsp6I family type II restriction endonuclease n=1 Tax=unclassified Mycoplasma TaxID=2683645 RepID=UPI00211C5A4C|nr:MULTISPECIES: Bsp6I family type II restriction endonuclease [unclassified Mycoplasma]UUM19683.1 Bsp6I family type II restriction endonuclease [Mycoplasma sp. 1578d]UUM24666.1 Bsp6I family type II restriction endonuclease [Mycoplasma sp. 3686d]